MRARRVAPSAMQRRSQVLAGMALAGLLATLAGCAGQPAATAGRDVVTASDETESAKRARVRLELASAYFAQGQTTTALDEVKQALVISPNLPEGYNLRGLVYAAMGESTLADESFRRALQLAPRDADTLHNYGWYQCQQGRYAEAETLFAQALALPQYRDAPRTLLTQGVCYARSGKLPQAEQVLVRAFEFEPGNPAIAVNLSEVLYRRGDYERARFYVRRVNAQADRSSAQTLWLAMRIEHRTGDVQQLNDLALQLRNRFPQSRELALYERGQFDE